MDRTRWTLRRRLVLWAIAAAVLPTLLSVLAGLRIVRSTVLRQLDHELAEEVGGLVTLAAQEWKGTGRFDTATLLLQRSRHLEGLLDSPLLACIEMDDRTACNNAYSALGIAGSIGSDVQRAAVHNLTHLTAPGGDFGFRVAAMPWTVEGSRKGTVFVAVSLASTEDMMREVTAMLILASLVILAVTCTALMVGVGRALRPLGPIVEFSRRLRRDTLGERLPDYGTRDEGELARTLNQMAERLGAAFAGQETFLSTVSHELRTPLTIIRGHLEVLELTEPFPLSPSLRGTLDLVLEEVDRLQKLVADLLLLAQARRPENVVLADIELTSFLHRVFEKATALAPRRWQLESIPPAHLRGDAGRLTQLLLNLFQNSVDNTGEGDAITLGAAHAPPWVRITVSDTGRGIDPQEQERIFERFVRLPAARDRQDARRDRIGLGLTIARGIAEAHGGKLSVESRVGAGSAFTLWLPAE